MTQEQSEMGVTGEYSPNRPLQDQLIETVTNFRHNCMRPGSLTAHDAVILMMGTKVGDKVDGTPGMHFTMFAEGTCSTESMMEFFTKFLVNHPHLVGMVAAIATELLIQGHGEELGEEEDEDGL